MATFTWDGGGANDNWKTAANWGGDVAPTEGSDLVFPSGAAQLTSHNNFNSGTNFNSILFTGSGYMLIGNAITLTSGITSTIASGTNTFHDLPIELAGAQTWTSTTAGTNLDVSTGTTTVDLNGANLTIAGAGNTTLGAIIDTTNAGAANGVVKNGTGTLTLNHVISIPMTLTINAGTVQVSEADTQMAVVVNGGALSTDAAASTGVITAVGGTITPGGTGTTGILSVQGSTTLSPASTLAVNLNGTTAGTGFDQVNVTGAAILGGAALSLSEGVASTTGSTFTILTATGGVTGTFGTLPDLATFISNGRVLQIDYTATSVILSDLGPAAATNADVGVTISDTPDPVAPAGSITYTVTLSNTGTAAATGVVLTGAVPANTTFMSAIKASGPDPTTLVTPAVGGTGPITVTYATLAAGASATFTVVVNVNGAVGGGTTITSTASASTTSTDANLANNAAVTTTLVATTTDLQITKTDGSATEIPGTPVTYTITVTNPAANAGGAAVTGATVTDIVGAILTGVTFTASGTGGADGFANGSGDINQMVNLPAGSTITYIVTGTVNASLTGTLTNTATITAPAGVTDTNLVNNSAADTDQLLLTADLSITKTDNVTSVEAGGSVTYTIVVTNNGPSNVTGATVADNLDDTLLTGVSFVANGTGGASGFSSGTGDINQTVNLPVGATVTYTVTAAVIGTATGSLINTATITAPAGVDEVGTGPNSATDTDTIVTAQAQTDLIVSKTTDQTTVTAGEQLTYTITVENTGSIAAQNVVVTDAVPTGTTFVSATGPFTLSTPMVGDTGVITAALASLGANTTATLTVTVLVDNTVAAGDTIANSVTVTSTTSETSQANNTAIVTTDVGGEVLPLECVVTTNNIAGDPRTAVLIEDADGLGGALLVTGTAKNDSIVIVPISNNRLRVLFNGRRLNGDFNRSDVQHIVVFGGSGNDTIVVNASLNIAATLLGEAGSDHLFGARGIDGLDGGDGNDFLYGGNGADTLCGGNGNDFLFGQNGNDTVGGDAGNDRVFGQNGHDLVLGGDGNDFLYGGTGSDQLFGQAGNDRLFGDAGNDLLLGGDGNDKLYGSSGRDILIGGAGSDQLFGESGDDILVGGSTNLDEDQAALLGLLADWSAAASFSARVSNLRLGLGSSGVLFDESSVFDDFAVDQLWGDGGSDWFITGTGDRVRDKAGNDRVN